jgi:hypothetical protein
MNEPLTFANAESALQLTIRALSNVLSAKDQEFLQKSMRVYGDMRVKEAATPAREQAARPE